MVQNFKLDFVDLWLMHWPEGGNTGDEVDPPIKDTWQRMERQFDVGKAKVMIDVEPPQELWQWYFSMQ